MICKACSARRHDQCSARITIACSPCDCTHCWGTGNYRLFVRSTLKALAKANEAAKIESLEDTPE
jgi:hypothetical protein